MRVHGLGHVVLKVRDLNQSVPFYRDVLGLKKVGQAGEKMVFFSFVDNHHDLALLETEQDAAAPNENSPGLHMWHLKWAIASMNSRKRKIG